MNKLQDYIAENEHFYKDIIRKHNIDKDVIESALDHVKRFIIQNELIVYGGLAIDYALRLKNDSIYHKNDIPDYDCISDKNVDLAYDLGERLHKLGFENVKVIKAIHEITMRVRINLITVMDLSYYPSKYYNQCKTLNYEGIKIIHPDIQRLDMHKAFCFPFNNSPMEDIFHRWEKDIIRFNKYEKYYPLKYEPIDYDIKYYTFKLPDIITSKKIAFHSFAAYALYYRALAKMVKEKDMLNIKKININFGSTHCSLEMPFKANLCLVSSEYEPEYHSLLEKVPKSTIVNGNVSIYITNLLTIVQDEGIQIVNIQYVLMHFLFFYNFFEDYSIKLIYKNFYIYTLRMIEIAEKIKNNKLAEIFLPSIKNLGKDPIYIPNNNQNLPINYTPSKENSRQTFDYSNFKISGEKI
jgi:hypothetical protein